ncbi:MAG: IS21 family transposase [Planctomycetota bacterium]
MLTVADYELIRRKFFVDGQSARAIAKELEHSRKTVAKAIANPVPPGYRLSEPRMRSAIERYRTIIDAWLETDESRPRKQRHTSQRIYERLRDEHGYAGSASSVRRYVAWRKTGQGEVFMPLYFGPGEEAQVDWGEATVIHNGVERKVQLFCMKLCHSHGVFVRAYERANLESFLDGHVRAFAFFGGVPKRIAYDNLKSAVVWVGRGRQRRLNRRFMELRSWYLFDSRFCNVAKGNEKGHVENLVKRSQRTFLTPLPEVQDLDTLNAKLAQDCLAELDRTDREGQSYRALWEAEKPCLLTLPAEAFPACQERSSIVDKESLVQFDGHRYSVPVRWAYHPCVLKGFVDRVELYCQHQCVAVHRRSYGPERFVLEPRHYLPLLERKPGCLDQARPFQGNPWGEDFALLRRELEYRLGDEGTRQFIRALLLLTEHPEDEVRQAVGVCVRRRAFSVEAVVAAMRNEPLTTPVRRLDLAHRPELAGVGEGIRPVSLYDQLARAGEEVAA